MNRPRPINLARLCQLFEINPKELPDLKPGPMPEMEKKLKEVKEIFKRAYRKLAIKYHPDKGATPNQIEHFKIITSVYKDFQKLKVTPIPRPRPAVVIRTYGRSYSSTTASSTTTGGWGSTWYFRSRTSGETTGTED